MDAQGLSKKVQPMGIQSILAGTCFFFTVNLLVPEFSHQGWTQNTLTGFCLDDAKQDVP